MQAGDGVLVGVGEQVLHLAAGAGAAAGAAGPRPECRCPWSRRASGGRAGSTPVTVVDQRVEDQAEARAAGVDHAGVAEDGELAGGGLQGDAGAVGGGPDDVGEVGAAPSSTAATAASAPARATVRNVPSSGSATAV